MLGIDRIADEQTFQNLLLDHRPSGHIAPAGRDHHGHDPFLELIKSPALVGRALGGAEQLDDPALDVAL